MVAQTYQPTGNLLDRFITARSCMWRRERVATTLSTNPQLHRATEKKKHRRALAATNKDVEEICPDKRRLGIDQRVLILDEDMRAVSNHDFHPHAIWMLLGVSASPWLNF